MNYGAEYLSKLRTPEEAVKVVKDGDWVDYTVCVGFPPLLDKALSERRDELHDVKIRGNLIFGPVLAAECDPTREHFCYNTWHMSAYERNLSDRGLCSFIPMVFRDCTEYYRHFLRVNVAMLCVTPMDKHGYFNLSCGTGVARGIIDAADIVILEVNEELPYLYGAFHETIHVSEADFIVEGHHDPLPEIPLGTPSKEDILISDILLPYIRDGSVLQLGIGGMPNLIGSRLAESDVKDLSMHTELCTDAYYKLAMSGKLTNKRKALFPGKGLTGIALGTREFYKWIDRNAGILVAPLGYVNAPENIAQMDNMISINNCISVDLYGQVNAESSGLRQISGTGGQLDYLTGASMARGGKAFITMTSTFTDRKGKRHSRIKPHLSGDIITDPRSQTYYIVTEYGAVNLCGRSTWERAALLISIAHPDFREELVQSAERQGIWRRSNRR